MRFKVTYSVTFCNGRVNVFNMNGSSMKGNPINEFTFIDADSKENCEEPFFKKYKNQDDRTYKLIKLELA